MRTDGRTLTLAVVHDLTERKRAEQSWRESEARYRALIEALPEAVIVHRGGEPLFGNQAAAALVGAQSVEALASQSVLSFVVEADRDAFRERGRLILEQGLAAEPREVRVQRIDGSVFWAEAEGVPVSFDGKPAVQTIVRDITARKVQEESRAAAAERTRQQSAALLRLATRPDARADDLHAALSRICTSACHVLAVHRVDIFSLEEDAVAMRWVAACAEGRIVSAPAPLIPSQKDFRAAVVTAESACHRPWASA